MHDDVFVYYVELPEGVNETVTPCNGGYNVCIDPRQSEEGVMRSYMHALRHIMENDFEKEDVNQLEKEAHTV